MDIFNIADIKENLNRRIEYDKKELENNSLSYPFRFCYEMDIKVAELWMEILK